MGVNPLDWNGVCVLAGAGLKRAQCVMRGKSFVGEVAVPLFSRAPANESVGAVFRDRFVSNDNRLPISIGF